MIKEVDDKDLQRALDLVNRVFSEFVAIDYSEQGRNTFDSYLKGKLQEVSASLKSGEKKIWAYYQENEILGVIATQSTSHISLMFVDKQYHRQGIARQLFDVALDWFKKNKDVKQITVNSSPYAVKAYEHLGFVKTEEQQEKDGIIYVPMMRTL